MATSVTFNGSTYSVPAAGETGWSALSNFLIDLANNAQTKTNLAPGTRTAVTSPVTVANTDFTVLTNLTAPGAVTVNLPAGTSGKLFAIADGKGDAQTNNVTINGAAQNINGAASYVMSSNYEAVLLQFSTTAGQWEILSTFRKQVNLQNATTTQISAQPRNTGTIWYDTTQGAPVYDNGSTLVNFQAAVVATDVQAGIVSTALQKFGGLKKFVSGSSDVPNPRAAEGTVVVTLTDSDPRHQIFNVNAGQQVDLRMPTTNILSGESWLIENKGTGTVHASASNLSFISNTTQAPGGNGDALIGTGYMILEAMASTPATPGDWRVTQVFENFNATGTTTGLAVTFSLFAYRMQKNIHVILSSNTAAASGSTIVIPAATMPTTFYNSTREFMGATVIFNNSTRTSAIFDVGADGSITLQKYDLSAFAGTCGITSSSTALASLSWTVI